MDATYRSQIRAHAHKAMERLFAVGLIEPANMRYFDRLCRADAGVTTVAPQGLSSASEALTPRLFTQTRPRVAGSALER
jgi:hypothetical protein